VERTRSERGRQAGSGRGGAADPTATVAARAQPDASDTQSGRLASMSSKVTVSLPSARLLNDCRDRWLYCTRSGPSG
jgi:hypothetical protein